MDQLIVEGGHQLAGTITPSGNKNAAQPALIATLLTDDEVILRNVPDIRDIRTILEILAEIGVNVTRLGPNEISIRASGLQKTSLDPALCKRVRGAFMFAGPLVARHGHATIPRPGGDRIGRRRIDAHIQALEAMGAEVATEHIYELKAPAGLHGADVFLDERSVTATENALMAAVLAHGQTVIRNAACEPHVQDLCRLLNKMGGQIAGVGTHELTVEGVSQLHGADYTLGPDYMEVGSLIGLAAVTDSDVRIKDAAPQDMRRSLMVFSRLGVDVQIDGDDLLVASGQKLEIVPDIGDAIPKIDDDPWPGFPADLMSVAIVVATQSRGTVLFFEKMFESRMFWLDRLIEMGAKIILCDPHRAVVVGPSKLYPERLTSPDIRAGMALLIASLCAEGQSVISNIEQIDRGYERIDERLRLLGANITRVSAADA
ncbi:MAG: UDP-N-acetylglucosamine 1-carboxyvinyltransferase [Gemmatimonadetes bacterium]|nr:UDP-N-acetylglucosamine 1-carboxyvinyltransferase [Gemmatimonadota bacterium]MBT6150221.1 UDP-N-acetylglucosamine 1-carboxyvinyltransferase [Gemmatimonadota bacterium]MBT7860837.1 UDP-N-acetylglucosamine 1-carboxyvinyltransferase [Gemmatimonadota bacterium]